MKSKRGEEFIFDSAPQKVNDVHGHIIVLKGYHILRKVGDYRLFGRIKEWIKGESWYIVDNDSTNVINCYGYVEDRCLNKVTK